MEPFEYDVKITVHDLYLIILWDTNYFDSRPESKRICGKRVADGLFSVEAFASNPKPEYRIAQALGEKLRPQLSEAIKQTEYHLKASLDAVYADLQDPLVTAIDTASPPTNAYMLFVEKGKGAPLVNSFIRLFILMDHITTGLKSLHFKGCLTKAEYKKREDADAKPLRKLMNDLNVIIKKYHQQRKTLSAKP
ncbi:MAG TPA: hypothetical protein ENI17_02885 [Pseudomonas xinjiangensis]|uniref:Uncharacterized protein n=2 Tax=root TaxID=1 RepID=A0A7V1BRL1_9GAMM|nr:hypothetical protein [Halopseudomonas xinjiangensis]HEC46554.1 hypothetical protein [Halopseudomonas xinjiangensis]